MKLVKYENYELKFEDELLLLKPFRLLHKQDKSKTKEQFVTFLSILYFLVDPRSDYQYITDEKERLQEICASNGYTLPKWNETELQCKELYTKLTTTASLGLLTATKVAIDKVRHFLENVDLFQTDERGKPIYTVNTITSAIKQIPQLAKDLEDTERAISRELQESSRVKGATAKTLMDDAILI